MQDESADTSVAYAVAYGAAFFAGDDERAAARLETSLRSSGHAPAPFRMALMSDAAVFQGRRRHRPDLATAWRNDLPPDAPAWVHRCVASVAGLGLDHEVLGDELLDRVPGWVHVAAGGDVLPVTDVGRLLVLQEVDRFAPPEPAASDVDGRVAAALARLGSTEGAERRLEELGVSREWVRQWVRDDLRIAAYVEQRF